MDKKRPDWHMDIVTVVNILDDPFHYKWDSIKKPVLGPGEARQMPRFLANHVAKHMIDRKLLKEDPKKFQRLKNKGLRTMIKKDIIVDPLEVKKAEGKAEPKGEVKKDVKKDVKSYEDMDIEALRKVAKGKKIKVTWNMKKGTIVKRLSE